MQACQPKNKEEKAIWASLDRIWAKTHSIDPGKIESAVDQAVKEVRGAKAPRRT